MLTRNPSIKFRLVATFVVLAVMIVAVGEWMSRHFAVQFKAEVAARNGDLVRNVAENIGSYLEMEVNLLEEAGSLLADGGTAGREAELGSLRDTHPFIEQFLLLAPDGTVSGAYPPFDEEVRPGIGGLLSAAGPLAFSAGQTWWSPAFKSPFTGKQLVAAARAFDNGTLMALMQVEAFPAFRFKTSLRGMNLAVLDPNGTAIFYSGAGAAVGSSADWNGLPSGTGDLGSFYSGEGTMRYVPGILSVAGVPISGWQVIVFQAEEDALFILHRGRNLVRVVLLILFLAGVFVTIALHAGFQRPLKDLERQAAAMTAGEFEELVEPGFSELEELAGTFNEMARAVTSREEALRSSEARYRLIADNTSDIIWTADLDLTFTYISPSVFRMIGVTPAQAMEQPLSEMLTPGSLEKVQGALAATLEADRKGQPVDDSASLYLQMYRRDWSVCDVEVNVKMVRDEDGQPLQFIGVARDISDRVRSSRDVARNEETLRALFNAIPDILLLLGPDGTILQINDLGAQMYGQEPVGLRLRNYFDIVREEIRVSRKEAFEQVVMSGVSAHFEEAVDNHHHYISIYPVISPDEDVEAVAVSIREVTRQKQVEEEVKLAQARLIQANKMTSLGLMVSSVAHEINNPNNFIMFNSRMVSNAWMDSLPILEKYCQENPGTVLGGLECSEMSEVIPKLLDGIIEGSNIITRIVNDLKDYIRGNLQDLREDVEINRVVEGARSLLGNQISKVTNSFTLELAEDLPVVIGNPQQLGQVVVNLVLNSLEALQDKNSLVSVQTGEDKASGQVYIKVRDEGSGMPEDVLRSAFEPFFSTRLDEGGTGLGLTISNSIVKAHQGRMEIDSEPGQGTGVTIYLPAVKG
jgi:PAS domain S-box-containing protein